MTHRNNLILPRKKRQHNAAFTFTGLLWRSVICQERGAGDGRLLFPIGLLMPICVLHFFQTSPQYPEREIQIDPIKFDELAHDRFGRTLHLLGQSIKDDVVTIKKNYVIGKFLHQAPKAAAISGSTMVAGSS